MLAISEFYFVDFSCYLLFTVGQLVQKTSDARRYWVSIASSSDGTKLAAVSGVPNAFPSNGYIYASTNSGDS